MAESKKTSSKNNAQSNAELAEQLRLAAEILDGASEQPAEKKSAAKKPTAKKPASKTPTKKPTTKKPATKAEPKKVTEAPKEEVKEEQPVAEEPKTEAPVVEQPPEQPVQPAAEATAEAAPQKKFGNRRSDCKNCGAENDKNAVVCAVCGAKLPPLPNAGSQGQAQPVVEEKAEEPAPVVEEKAEQPAPAPVEQKTEQPSPAPAQPRSRKSDAFVNKSKDIINKGKLPLFIVANALLFLSFLFLMIRSFDIPNKSGVAVNGTLFTYYSNGAAIKYYWQDTAGAWANGGYAMMGILMTFACLVPLALIVKNVVFFILKKDKNVHMLDAIVTFAFLIAYLGVVGMYGANITWTQVLSLIMSIILLTYTIFVILLENREGPFPFFSIANLVLIMLCMFLLTSTIIYDGGGFYAAKAAAASAGGGFAFIVLLIALAALVLLVVMQVKKLPGKIAWLFEFLVPAVAGVCALIAIISFAGANSTPYGMGGGFIFGVILTILLAAADVVFALVPKLHKFNVKVTDRMSATSAPAPAQPVQSAAPQAAPAENAPATNEQPAPEAPAQSGDKIKCPACGTENEAGDVFCLRCGRKLK